MKLYGYWRSTTSYRVRAALNLKKLEYEYLPIDISAGAQFDPGYVELNPSAGVPSLVLEDETTLTQSLAILEYLDAKWPEPRIIPEDILDRANVMAVAQVIAPDIHPLNNLRVMGQLKSRFKASSEECSDWMQYWMKTGFEAVENMIDPVKGFAFGTDPNIADLCIVAQMYNARRWGLDLGPFPSLVSIEQACLEVPEIAAAHPDRQPDAQEVT